MLMKIVTAVLTVLLILTLTAGALFYLKAYKPMAEDNARMTAGMPELDKATLELRQRKEKESRETAWLKPAIEALSAGLGNEITSGKVEVLSAGNRVVVNIAEQTLYLPDSYTFAKESPQIRANLVALLKGDAVKGKDIYIGNTTHAVPAQGRGRKKIAAKDARTLAAERSAALIKYLEKNGVSQDALIAAAYSPQQPKMGSLIKDRKTVIIIESRQPSL
jgi:outer membrane protein OmpA-like peptidoglycan-associated protein